MKVIEDAAHFAELPLRERRGGAVLLQLMTEGFELLKSMPIAAGEVADGPAGDHAHASRHRHAEEGYGHISVHADCSRVVGACS